MRFTILLFFVLVPRIAFAENFLVNSNKLFNVDEK